MQVGISTVEGSPWDPNSIMHYEFVAGLIQSPAEYSGGLPPDWEFQGVTSGNPFGI